jgi:hypothetical protein
MSRISPPQVARDVESRERASAWPVSRARGQPAPGCRPQQRVARPALEAVKAQLHSEAAVPVWTYHLFRKDSDDEARVLGRNIVSRPQLLLRDLDEAQQRLGLLEVICFHILNERLTLDPRDRLKPGTAEGGPSGNPMPDLELGPIHVGDGSPAALIVFDAVRPASREWADRRVADEPRSCRRAEIHQGSL